MLGSRLGFVAIPLLLAACAERPQPGGVAPASSAVGSELSSAPKVGAAVPAEVTPQPQASARTVVSVPASPTPSAAPATAPAPSSSGASTSDDSNLDEARLLDANGAALPQTEERPSPESAAFKRRLDLLAEAIVKDDPKLAKPAFFPIIAYAQVKAVAKPERDWQFRLMRNFERDIHEYHRALGRDAEGAKLAGVTVAESQVRWMKPGSEGNRLGYFRVVRSRLRFDTAAGKSRDFELTSLISWRGEWYVVHLHGFE
jgi:hypothetical protein